METLIPSVRHSEDPERYRSLLEINNAIATHLKKEDLLRATCGALRNVIPCEAAGIAIYESDLDAFRFFALDGDLSPDRFAVGELVDPKGCCFGAAFASQKPVLRGDLSSECAFLSDDRLRAAGMRSYCTVPMILHGKSIGALSVVSREPHCYTGAHAEFLQEVSNQLALAVANMRAYEEIALLKKQLAIENRHLRAEIREAESHALIAENAALMGRFAAALTHELNSPIGALRSALDSIKVLREQDPKIFEQTQAGGMGESLRRTMLEAADRLVEIVARMKRLTNLDRSEVLTVDLNALVLDVIDLLKPTLRKDVDVELDLAPLPHMQLKPQQMSALLMAVLQNSVDEVNGARLVRVSTRQDGTALEVVVQDDGRGLPSEEIDGIFEPSFKLKGTRISSGNWSLFSARQMVRAHGGRIDVRSSPGIGTSVHIRLPRSLSTGFPQGFANQERPGSSARAGMEATLH